MWENRCKVAVSGVGFSKVSRTADVPLAVHALIAVKEAVADSGLELSDIDGLATYPELPATGHAEVDGISVVSVNCMMAMLKLPNLALTQRRHTQHNPHAYFYGTELSREDYLASRMVAYPFCLFDCDIPVQGAVAIVLTTADRACDLKPTPAYLAGYGQRLHFEVAGRIGSLADYMEGGRSSAKLTWERSGFGPKDVDVAQIYDGFSASVIYGLESYGFCQEGEALDFIQDGRIELAGDLPLNTFGGSLGTGRIHGLWHIIEGALQASGRAGSRQVKDANVSFVGASAPIVTGTTFIFVGEPY